MSDNLDAAELEALASDPHTDWDVLHWIAENYPQLRPAVAANPGTYQELVDALAALGDPDIDAAIALRPFGKEVSSAQAATNPMAGMWDTMTHHIPAYREDEDAAAAPYTDPHAARTYEAEDVQPQEQQAHEPYAHEPYAEEPWAPAPVDEDAAAHPLGADDHGQQHDDAHLIPTPDVASDDFTTEEPAAEPHAYEHLQAADEIPDSALAQDEAESEALESSGPVSEEPESAESEPGERDAGESDEDGTYPEGREALSYLPAAQETAAVVPPPAALSTAYREPGAAEEQPRRRSPLVLIAAAVVGVVAIGAIIALVANLLGGSDEAPVAEPTPTPTQQQTQPPGGEETEGEETEAPAAEESPGADEEALVQARAAAAALPDETSCQSGDDAGVVTAFLTAAGTQEAAAADDADALEQTFAGLQSACSSTHAAGVFEAARSGSEAPENGAAELLTEVGTDWVNRSIGLGGAQEMDGFVTPNGNIQCEFSDGVRCTAYQHSYAAPAGCSGGTTYRMQVDGGTAGPHCEDPVERTDRQTLSVNSSATDGFLVCISMSDRVSCYNSVTGGGFEISERGHYPY